MEEKKYYVAHNWDSEKILKLSEKEKALIEWFLETVDFDPDNIYLECFEPKICEFDG